MTSIPVYPVDESTDTLAEALDRAGCLVVTGAAAPDVRNAVMQELAPHLERADVQEDDPNAFYPGRTRRITALAARSKTAGELLLHPTPIALCDHFLLPNSRAGYQVHVTAALEVGPGARSQILHREEDSFTYFPLPRPHLVVATMWAISDFRADNGATLLVPGSHRWPAERKPEPDEIVQAEMPAGSLLFWMGGTLHGAGANTSSDWRYGVILTYSLGWLRQEENQYLDVTPEVARELSPELRRLIGYDPYAQTLGIWDPRARNEGGPA